LKITTKKAVLTERETLKEVVDCLTENLTIKTQGACAPTDLFNILVGAASKADTIENTASSLKNSFSPRKIRYHLNNKFKSFKELETQLNQGLISKLPRRIKKKSTNWQLI
jgi:putative transposase